jgi:Fe-S cluster assembly protein SufD
VHEADHTVDITIEPERDSNVTLYFILPKESAHKKYTITVNFNHQQAAFTLFGLYQLHDKNAVEILTQMHHRVPHCSSKQIWKGVMHDASKAAFEGRIIVHPFAQKTSAHLSNKNLLLSKTAEVNTKPILEIEADDLQCTHGATVGCLDQHALFYLRSRGISEKDARQLLIDAFVQEIIDESKVSHDVI